MATVDNPKMVAQILRADGVYRDGEGEDPPCFLIASYLNDYGKIAYSLCSNEYAIRSLYGSPHCQDIKVLWSQEAGMTPHGEDFLKSH